MKKRFAVAIAAIWIAGGLGAYEGPVFTIEAWRGETAWAKIPDKFAGEIAKQAIASGDVELEFFGVAAVDYLAYPTSEQVLRRLDRVVSDFAAPALCRVAVKSDAKAGVRDFGPLHVKVVDRVLPPAKEWKYYLDLWQHPWAVARQAKVEPFTPAHYKEMAKVLGTLAECGQKTITATLVDLPWNHQCYDAYHSMIGRVKAADGSWRFDYKLFDEYVEFALRCGIGPDIACYTMCPWEYVVRWQNEKGEVQRGKAIPGSPLFNDFWGDFLVDFAAHLERKGWLGQTYIAMDERSPEDVRKIVDLVREKAPGLKIAMAGNRKPSDFDGIEIENFSQVLGNVTDEYLSELDQRRQNGQVTTYYVCCWPPRPNTFMSSSNDEAFYLGAFPAFSGFDGFLRWAANSWPADPCADASCYPWSAGDTFLIYPDGGYSTRLINLRAGIVAAEKLRILRERNLFVGEIDALKAECDFKKALAGDFDHAAFRRKVEALVNRD